MSNKMHTFIKGVKVSVGEHVCFKSDVEQCGKVVSIRGRLLTLVNANGFDGDYIEGECIAVVDRDDCWVE